MGLLGQYARLNRNSRMKTDLTKKGYQASIGKNEITRILAINKDAYRVQLTSGEEGYVNKRFLSGIGRPLETLALSEDSDLFKRPNADSFGGVLAAGDQLAVLGRHEDFWFVRNEQGELGWITEEQKRAQRPF